MKTIYILFSCDAWKTYTTGRIIMATTDKQKILEQVRRELACGSMVYDGELNTEDLHEINTRLTYGFVEELIDGEIQ